MNLLNPPLNLLRPPKFVATVTEPPSITQQGFDVRIVDFGMQKKSTVDFFNSGLVNAWGRDWLLTRRSEYDPEIWLGRNQIWAFGLTDLAPQVGYPLKPKALLGGEHWEDGRGYFHDNHVWISACNFVWYPKDNMWTGAHIAVAKFNKNWKCVERFDPVYGNNLDRVSGKMGHEKNWLWFIHEGEWHMIYKASPHAVVVFDEKLKYVRETASEWPSSGWPYGEIRGGCPPVLVDGKYWTFFHSSIPMGANLKRRYFMGVYCFEAKPPFRVTGFTPKPLLTGSKHDRWAVGKPCCVFPVGSIFRNGEWIISGGVNDFDTFIARIPHGEIEKSITKV